jgi:transposase
MEGIVTLNAKEQKRLLVLNKVNSHEISVSEGATILALSQRHIWRLLGAYRREGCPALAHGNRGRKPAHALDEALKAKIVELACTTYRGFNIQHMTEYLDEKESINISRSSVRRILLSQGLRSPRKRRPPKHRSRRERYPQEGMLLQIDGSPHDWLEGRGPYLTLIGAIDDATGKVPYAFFQEQEDSKGYFLLLREIALKEGIPLALYHDRHSIFELSRDKLPSLEEQLEGKRPLTQFGRLMEELGITSIPALSPQAKGRVERLWGTFQDRLKSELRLSGARTTEEANRVLADFLPRYDRKFAVEAQDPRLAYRRVEEDFKADEFFCFKYQRIVGGDNVVCFGKQRLQVLPSPDRLSYAHCKVEVHVRLDGGLEVYYQGRYLDTEPAPLEPARLRESALAGLPIQRRYAKPAPDHPWRGNFRVFVDQGNS